MIRTSAQAKKKARQLFRMCLVEGRLDEQRVHQVVNFVLQARRRGYVPLLKEFQRLVRLELAAHSATIESAFPLSPPFEARVRATLEAQYGSGIAASFAQNRRLIGGTRIRIGSDVYDGTVQAKLAALQRSFGILGSNGFSP